MRIIATDLDTAYPFYFFQPANRIQLQPCNTLFNVIIYQLRANVLFIIIETQLHYLRDSTCHHPLAQKLTMGLNRINTHQGIPAQQHISLQPYYFNTLF